ncbi:phage terminase large subunit family protein [Thiohalophilus sp.]|uniref:phage terminase large subunit family protein n=1 Tax=Thiohalophilus sp. TaxID=3028392 RepID=UPI003A1012B1
MSAAADVMLEKLYHVESGGQAFAQAWADGWDMPEPLPVDEWADNYRVLPRESSSEHGPWRTSRTPYLREPMQVLSGNHSCKRAVMVFGTQTGKTETGNNWVGASVHQSPSSMMIVQPTVEMGKRWARQRLNPMVALTPELQALIETCPQPRQREHFDDERISRRFYGNRRLQQLVFVVIDAGAPPVPG